MVLAQKFGSRTTQKKDLPEPKRQRIEETPLELPEGFIRFPIQQVTHPFLPIKQGVYMYNTVVYYLNLH